MDTEMQTAFQIETADNVATALTPLVPGAVRLLGNTAAPEVLAVTDVPLGHKVALRPIVAGEPIRKYNVVIGCATVPIAAGAWVHLHNMKSLYDERSSHLDAVTGAPRDTQYR